MNRTVIVVVAALMLCACGRQEPEAETVRAAKTPTAKPRDPAKKVDHAKKPGHSKESRKLNRLANEKSLYLRQHGANPVDWYPWGKEAFEKAKRENKPIFLSIGYSSCHWCHVMEHECFEDDDVAKVLNDHFVSIKVDREERPDVDEVYMSAAQALMRGGGGWPLSVWMTPDKKPFFAGTYFPKHANPQLGAGIGFLDILGRINEAWNNPQQRKQIEDSGKRVAEFVQSTYDAEDPDELTVEAIKTARVMAEGAYDPVSGGFASAPRFAPKFPSPSTVEMFLRYALRYKDKKARDIVTHTLTMMAWGGIHDHVGGGFHRYSVTREWLVPHFEKMLYDNGQLLALYAWAYLVTGDEHYADTARDIGTWVLREMTGDNGGFLAAQDADDPGGPEGEGGFYVWDKAGIESVLGVKAAHPVLQRFGIKESGNWQEKPGQYLLQVVDRSVAFDPASRKKLYENRETRPKPLTDEKVLTSWNGLMISGFARSYQVFLDKRHLDAAVASASFIKGVMTRDDGRLIRRWAGGEAAHDGVLVDYAYMIAAYLDLYETTFDIEWLKEALRLNELTIKLFHDPKEGGFFFTANDSETLIARGKPGYDNARPSGNGAMAMNLARIAELTGDLKMKALAKKTLDYFGARVTQSATAFGAILNTLDFMDNTREIFIAGALDDPATRALIEAVWRDPDRNRVIAVVTPEIEKLLPPAAGKPQVNGKPAAYVCRNFVCKLPVTDPKELGAAR